MSTTVGARYIRQGIAYQRPRPTGLTISYRTGDDAWQVANNPYPTIPTNPLYTAELVDIWTLVNNNVFGNTYRFTDQAGNQAVFSDYTVSSADTIIDHLNGLEWGINNFSIGNSKTWDECIDECNSLNVQGFDDWYLPNINEYATLVDYQKATTSCLILNAGRVLNSSTTPSYLLPSINMTYYTIGSYGGIFSTSTKTSSNRNYIPVRRRY